MRSPGWRAIFGNVAIAIATLACDVPPPEPRAPTPRPVPTPVPPAPTIAPPPAPRERPFAERGDVALTATNLGVGRASHAFHVDRSCPLGRVELDVEVEGMPDGNVRLRSPRGAESTLSLHVLTTTHFVRTWDWERLDDLHRERGSDVAGDWTLDVRVRGATYQGGDQPHGAPMPTPTIPRADLRIWCEPRATPHEGDEAIRVVRDVPPVEPRPGASVRALLPVAESCVVERATVEIDDTRSSSIGVRWRLVAPDGSVLPVTGWENAPDGAEHRIVTDVPAARGRESAGIWELTAPRASGNTVLRRAAITIECAPAPAR